MLAYLEMLKKNHWTVQSKLLKTPFSSGYSFNSLRAVLSKPRVTISNLPLPLPLQPGDNIPVVIGPLPKIDLGSDLPDFSLLILQESLVEFIVTHDEVCNTTHSHSTFLIIVRLVRQSTSLSALHFADFFSFSTGIFMIRISHIVPRCASSFLHPGKGVLRHLRQS